jgi:hypothetical protein
MSPSVLVGLGLASIIFFSVILLTAALMMRNQWNDLGRRPPPDPSARPKRERRYGPE